MGAAAGFILLILTVSWLGRADESTALPARSQEQIHAAEQARQISIDLNNPLRVHVEVNYSRGRKASWYPKGESPMLADLVKQGKLPPLDQRVGPEPCVVEGVEGIGKYGGTWHRLGNNVDDHQISWRLSGTSLLRWSPQGYPLVPHIAKSYWVSPDNREFIFELRKGMRWSDGHPFTADDIMYWWEHECTDKMVMPGGPPAFMKVRGKYGKVEKLGKHKVKFSFPEPHALFPARMASPAQRHPVEAPAHYKRKYHPRIGDKELIRRYMAAHKLPTPEAAYKNLSFGGGNYVRNPEYPRLWPWIYRTYKASTPQEFVRNPYYFMVDTQGNQLPYVDRILLHVKSPDMVVLAAANGETTWQSRYIRHKDYTLLMSQQEKYDYDVYHWAPGDGAEYSISVNLNRFVDPDKPETKLKAELLADKRFRQALSLAIDRQPIIDAEYYGQGVPGNSGPPPGTYFYDPNLFKKYAEYDPDRANGLLDEIDLTKRDQEGYRTFKDGTRMAFELNYSAYTGTGPGQFIVDDWAKVGIRVLLRERTQALFFEEAWAYRHDFSASRGGGEFFPLLSPTFIVPVDGLSYFALGYQRWYQHGGLYGRLPRPDIGVEPPVGHPVREAIEIYDRITAEGDRARRRELFHEILKIAAENVWHIGICSPQPSMVIVKKGFRNVPRNGVFSWSFLSPSSSGMETYYFENPGDSAGAIALMKRSIVEPTLSEAAQEATPVSERSESAGKVGSIIRYSFVAIGILLLVLLGVKHPYIGRRLLIMIPTLLVISVIVFTVIQLPPGDFVSARIMRLQETGEQVDYQRIAELREHFRMDSPQIVRYARWLGLKWFWTFQDKDEGLLQGNMGRSMAGLKPVNEIVGDRILLTVLVSLGTILFTWLLAIPIGIYSAVKQYSISDYAFTLIGFLGMCIPGFLLALLLMYVSAEWFDAPVSGLFSSRYGAQPEWTWGKVADLLKHIWIPVLVLGVGGTARMIRIMRGNLLDELRKPYVITARAKGLGPVELLLKYPVRVALNPFISAIGGLFPLLISGGAIVAIVLSLPTVGPLMLHALLQEDMYLAGSILLMLSLLGVVGTLVSDLLLLWLDPRIRFTGGRR